MSNAEHQGRQLERFESQLQNKDMLRVLRIDQTMIQVSWWSGGKLNPFISSYLFHVPCFQLFPIIRILYYHINTTHQRASAEDRLSYGLQVVLCLLLWCFGVSAVPIYAKRIFDGSFGVKKLLGNGVLPCDTPQIKVPAKFSNHTRHSPMHSITGP